VGRGKQLSETGQEFSVQIEAVESVYEFMLAYAAQGRESDKGAAGASEIRAKLESLVETLALLESDAAKDLLPAGFQGFAATLALDASRAGGAVALASSRSRISSQLVDNLNASIHLRAVLTDLFLIDEALKCE
jgi:hypothetical protein